jgi:hypothetical protein
VIDPIYVDGQPGLRQKPSRICKWFGYTVSVLAVPFLAVCAATENPHTRVWSVAAGAGLLAIGLTCGVGYILNELRRKVQRDEMRAELRIRLAPEGNPGEVELEGQ